MQYVILAIKEKDLLEVAQTISQNGFKTIAEDRPCKEISDVYYKGPIERIGGRDNEGPIGNNFWRGYEIVVKIKDQEDMLFLKLLLGDYIIRVVDA